MDEQVRPNRERDVTSATYEELARPAHSDTQDLEHLLRARGHRVSAARRLVLMALFAADWPIKAEDIAAGLHGLPPADLASIYRNLEMLEQQGLVYHLHLGHGPRHYRLVGTDEPCYVVCERCERIDSVTSSDLDGARAAISERVGYQASFVHFPLVGVCPACAAAAPVQTPQRPAADRPADSDHD
jgi:Fur family ferric uptake transcriptional regulator